MFLSLGQARHIAKLPVTDKDRLLTLVAEDQAAGARMERLPDQVAEVHWLPSAGRTRLAVLAGFWPLGRCRHREVAGPEDDRHHGRQRLV